MQVQLLLSAPKKGSIESFLFCFYDVSAGKMKSEYIVEVGITSDNLISFDTSTNSLSAPVKTSAENDKVDKGKGNTSKSGKKSCGCILLLHGDLRLLFDFPSGIITGISGKIGNLTALEQKDIQIPSFIDGEVFFTTSPKLVEGVSYILDIAENIAFDPQSKVLMIGVPDDNSICVRTCKNLYISVCENKICSIYVEMQI